MRLDFGKPTKLSPSNVSLIGPLGLSGPIVHASWSHSYYRQYLHDFFDIAHPTALPTHLPSHLPHATVHWPKISTHLKPSKHT